jgi:toxin ParE1/3/4
MIADHPLLGMDCNEVRRGYRRFRYKSHVVFHRLTGPDIEIVRILHAAMDVDRHL